MRSPMIENASYIPNKSTYSDLMVLKSNAGWYIGTIFNGEWGPEPGSRDSGYFETKEAAEYELHMIEISEDTSGLRTHP